MERIRKADYQVLGAKEPAEEPKSCHNSFQDVTFVISLVVQLAVLIFSLVTLGIGNPPPLLQLIYQQHSKNLQIPYLQQRCSSCMLNFCI